MSTASIAPPQTEVLFRHRRRPPALAFGVAGAVFIAVIALSVDGVLWQVLILLAALACLGLGLLARRRLWLEDQLITETAVAVVRRDGTMAEIPFERVDRIADRGTGIAFIRDDGRELAFNRNPHRKRMRRLLEAQLPDARWEEQLRPACDT